MIPINIGPVTGTAFGSSDELERIEVNAKANNTFFSKWYNRNHIIFNNDEIFARLVNLVRIYDKRGISLSRNIPTLASALELVYRNNKQQLHDTIVGKMLIIPVYNDTHNIVEVMYSNHTDLNYNMDALINSTSIVIINVKLLSKVIAKYDKRGIDTNRLITRELMIPIATRMTDHAIFNVITDIRNPADWVKNNGSFYMYDLNGYIDSHRTNITKAVVNLDTNPLDVLAGIPVSNPVEYLNIEDNYIDNLLWINLFVYNNIVSKARRINRDKLYDKFDKGYSLYSPRGRGDKYFGSCSSELLDLLQDEKFI